jgi:ubiquinone/menaquinone biosynthesis C-methylase UbiE
MPNMSNSTKQSIDFYEWEAETYDEKRWSTPSGRYVNAVQKGIVLDWVNELSGQKVLDVATGTGRFALEFAKRGAAVTVIDSSKSMLGIVERKFEKNEYMGSLIAHHGLATKLPFESGLFDICVCINAMNHIPQYDNVLKEMARVLAPDGVLIANYTNWVSYYMPFGIWVNLRKKSVVRDVYTKWFSVKEILRLHWINGLFVEEIVGVVQIPGKIENMKFLGLFKLMDRISRRGILRYVAPQVFIKAYKSEKR